MRAVNLAARRSRARGGLLLAMFAVVTIVVFLLAGMVGYLTGNSDAAVREALSAGPPRAAAVQLETRLAPDSEAQADAIGQLIDGAFAATEVAAHRTVRSNPIPVTVGDQQAALILAADPQLKKWATLVDGSWPELATSLDAQPAAIALQAEAAAALGLKVGNELMVEGRAMVIAATWLPTDASEPRWFSDSAVASGFDGLSLGPAVIAEGELATLPVRSYVRWTIIPAAVTAEGLPALAAALDSLAASADKASGTDNLELAGTLAERVTTVQRGLGAASALVAVPLVLVGVIGLITLGQLARLLAAVRRRETALLRARGASVIQVTALSLGEAAIAAVPGGAFGAVAAIGLLQVAAVDGTSWLWQVWGIALAGAGGAALLVGVIGWRAALTAVSGDGRGDSGRSRSSVTIGTTVLVLAGAALSLWQFKLYGSPLVAGQDGSLPIDPVTVVAPALTLLALAMLGLLAFAPAVALGEKLASRGRGIFPALPSRQVARRVSVFGLAVLLVTLSVGGTTLAASYSQSWAAASDTAAQARNGADVRVRLSPPAAAAPGTLVTTVPYLRLPGASDAATVLSTPARIADDTVALLALAADRMPGVMVTLGGTVPVDSISQLLEAKPLGIALDREASELSLTVSARSNFGSAGRVESVAWLQDADGSIARIALGTTALADALAGAQPLIGVLPEGRSGRWRVLAVEATLSGAEGSRGVDVTLSGLGEDYTLGLSSLEPSARATTFAERPAVPAVVSDALASRLSLVAGDTVSLRIPSTASTVEVSVVGTTPAIPGADQRLGLIVDLPILNAYLLQGSERIPQPDEVWISADEAAGLAASAPLISHSSASVSTLASASNDRLVVPAIVALWWGMAGALLLAVIAVLAITGTFVQDRRGEVLVLRALGMSNSEQGKNRLIELTTVLGAALAFGVVTGLIAAVLTVGELANTAVGSVTAVPLRFDVLGWVTLIFAAVAALVTVSTSYAGRVARQARDTEHREET